MTAPDQADALARSEALSASHANCFACGVSSPNGLRLHFEVDADGVARARWLPTADYCSYPDRIHGGVMATLIDSAIVHALFARGVAGVTAELTLRYLDKIAPDTEIEVAGRVASERRGVWFCEAEVRQGGKTAVRAGAKFMAMAGAGASEFTAGT